MERPRISMGSARGGHEVVRFLGIDANENAALAARGDGHVAADEEREAAEHLLLCQSGRRRPARGCGRRVPRRTPRRRSYGTPHVPVPDTKVHSMRRSRRGSSRHALGNGGWCEPAVVFPRRAVGARRQADAGGNSRSSASADNPAASATPRPPASPPAARRPATGPPASVRAPARATTRARRRHVASAQGSGCEVGDEWHQHRRVEALADADDDHRSDQCSACEAQLERSAPTTSRQAATNISAPSAIVGARGGLRRALPPGSAPARR